MYIISSIILKNYDTIEYSRGARIKSSSNVSPLNMSLWLWRNISAGEWKAIIINFLDIVFNCSYCLRCDLFLGTNSMKSSSWFKAINIANGFHLRISMVFAFMWHIREHILTLYPQKYIRSVLYHSPACFTILLNILLSNLIDDIIEIGSGDPDICTKWWDIRSMKVQNG